MYYVRTSGGGMMPINFKTEMLASDKKKRTEVKVKTPNKQKKRA
ncbi:MAG: hypothetical protein ACPHLK_11335 [Gammaproteobacteria bacterium]|jgi:hypothetical protein